MYLDNYFISFDFIKLLSKLSNVISPNIVGFIISNGIRYYNYTLCNKKELNEFLSTLIDYLITLPSIELDNINNSKEVDKFINTLIPSKCSNKKRYCYHGCNSSCLNDIKEEGLRGINVSNDLIEINNIFLKYGMDNMLGNIFLSSGKVYVSMDPYTSYIYSLTSPEWFSIFKNNLRLFGPIINKFSLEDKKAIYEFYNRYESLYKDSYPVVIMMECSEELDRYELFRRKLLGNLSNEEREKDYNYNYGRMSKDISFSKLDTRDSVYIKVPRYDRLSKVLNSSNQLKLS